MSVELVTYADIKNFLGLEQASIDSYPALGVIRESVTSAIEEYLGRDLESKERSETIRIHAPTSTAMIHLRAIPISSVSSVSVTILGDSESYTEDDDYEITGYGLRLFSKVNHAKVAVTYTGGYADDDVPEAISRAALLQVVHEFQSKDQLGAESVSTEGGTVSRPPLGLLKEVTRMLNKYVHPLKW